MGSIFSSPSPPPPPPPPPAPPMPDDPAIEDRRRKLRLSEQQRRGRAATILTSGIGDPSTAPVERPGLTSVLGGGR